MSTKERLENLEKKVTAIQQSAGVAGRMPEESGSGIWSWILRNQPVIFLAVSVLTLLVAIWAVLYPLYLSHEADDFNLHIGKIVDDKLIPTTGKLDNLTSTVSVMKGELDVLIIQRSAAQPANPQGIKQAIKVLNDAKSSGEKLDPEVIKDTGKIFINNAKENPPAWDAALAFLNYKSALNAAALPEMPSPQKELGNANYILIPLFPGGRPPRQIKGFGVLPREQSARFEPIGSSGTKVGPTGSAIVEIDDGILTLDGMLIKNVVFRNATIKYGGGPIRMENVYFVDCTFEIARTQTKFTLALLESNPVTLSI